MVCRQMPYLMSSLKLHTCHQCLLPSLSFFKLMHQGPKRVKDSSSATDHVLINNIANEEFIQSKDLKLAAQTHVRTSATNMLKTGKISHYNCLK